MKSSVLNKRFDVNSIRFRLWATFILFALVLLVLIWVLQIAFLNNYYEYMKKREANTVINSLQNTYKSNGYSLLILEQSIDELASSSDMTILVLDENYNCVIDSESSFSFVPMITSSRRYSEEIQTLATMLENSPLDIVNNITDERRGERTLGMACRLGENGDGGYVLYMFSPLFPVQSTVAILRSQLLYISVIAILLALALSLYLSNRISRPIKNITKAAADMGRGDYSVKFKGGSYSEINELANTLTHAEGELEKTDMYQKDLIANVSHDLRTPLTMIKSYAEMVRDLSGDDPVKRENHVSVIIEEADRLNVLVNDMLNLSRMQRKQISLELSGFDMVEATEVMLQSYEILTESEGYDIEFESGAEEFRVTADEAKIKQVMSNLVNNAVKYCGEDKKILVGLKRAGGNVRFYVTDHGEGIAPDEINHVWERYYKSSTHHVRSAEGSGLGLSIVKEILNLHKAEFGVESEVGKGSTFWFELPIA